MTKAGLMFMREVAFPLTYDGLSFERSFRADFVVENELVLEVKAVESLAPIHDSQVLTYMRLLRLRKGLNLPSSPSSPPRKPDGFLRASVPLRVSVVDVYAARDTSFSTCPSRM